MTVVTLKMSQQTNIQSLVKIQPLITSTQYLSYEAGGEGARLRSCGEGERKFLTLSSKFYKTLLARAEPGTGNQNIFVTIYRHNQLS